MNLVFHISTELGYIKIPQSQLASLYLNSLFLPSSPFFIQLHDHLTFNHLTLLQLTLPHCTFLHSTARYITLTHLPLPYLTSPHFTPKLPHHIQVNFSPPYFILPHFPLLALPHFITSHQLTFSSHLVPRPFQV